MDGIFSQVLNMSLTGSAVILFVMAARLFLKRFPKIFSYALWAVVLFRLLCPVSLSAPVSALKWLRPEVTESSQTTTTVSYLPVYDGYAEAEEAPVFAVHGEVEAAGETAQTSEALTLREAAGRVWLFGVGVMALYSLGKTLRLRWQLVGAIRWRGNVYLADHIGSPFVMGLLRPRIYMPSDVPMEERRYILAHERHHIHRGDHIIKLLAYLALCIHWFNPLVWAAFLLAGKDMEMSCDEAVIKKLGDHIRADYSASLLRLATHRTVIAGTPLSFGEGDTRGRVLNMAKWKRPRLWVSILCVILCAVIVAVCAFNPAGSTGGDAVMGNFRVTLPENITSQMEEGSMVLYEGKRKVGGIHELQAPEFELETEQGNSWEWVEALNIPEVIPADLFLMEGEERFLRSVQQTPFSDLLATYGKNGEDETAHYLYREGGTVYDLWFDLRYLADEDVAAIRATVRIQEAPVPRERTALNGAIDGSSVIYGDLTLTLPEDYVAVFEEDGDIFSIVFLRDFKKVGGITHWMTPDMELILPTASLEDSNMAQWVAALGIPEAQLALETRAAMDAGETPEEPVAHMIEGGGNYLTAWFCNELHPGKLNVEHNLFLTDTVVYDIWYDENVQSDAEALKYLETTRIAGVPTVLNQSAQITGPASVSIGELRLTLPQGVTLVETEEQPSSSTLHNYLLTNGAETIGGVSVMDKPEQELLPGHENMWQWVEALDVPENVPEERFLREVNWTEGNIITASYAADGIVETTHSFFSGAEVVYDIWFDVQKAGEETRQALLESAIEETLSAAAESRSFQFGDFYVTLPDDCSYQIEEKKMQLYQGETHIGGIAAYPVPEDPNQQDRQVWLHQLLEEGNDPNFGYMGGGSLYGDYEVNYFTDVPPGTEIEKVDHLHTFFYNKGGTVVYDVWFDTLVTTNTTRNGILASVTGIWESPQPETQETETAAVPENAVSFTDLYTSNDGTAEFVILTAPLDRDALEVENGLSLEELMEKAKAEFRTTSVSSFGFDPEAMGHEGETTLELYITDLQKGEDYLIAENTPVPTVELWGKRYYHFENGDIMDTDAEAFKIMTMNALDGSVLVRIGKKG